MRRGVLVADRMEQTTLTGKAVSQFSYGICEEQKGTLRGVKQFSPEMILHVKIVLSVDVI